MKEIETILEPISGYLMTILRNTDNGWYELEVGIPKSWVFNENSKISCENILETSVGRKVKIFPKVENVAIDDLVLFVKIIISTNQKIAEKEREFAEKMEAMKKSLEQQANDFYKELDDLKDHSFSKLSDKFTTELALAEPKGVAPEIVKPRKPRTKKVVSVSGATTYSD